MSTPYRTPDSRPHYSDPKKPRPRVTWWLKLYVRFRQALPYKSRTVYGHLRYVDWRGRWVRCDCWICS